MNTKSYFESLSKELSGLRDRVRHFIDDRHWQTDGEWKETVLRNFLRRNLPRSFEVGRGFVISKFGASTQIDLLIYDTSKPILFRDGDLVFLTPDAVRCVIEVKSKLTPSSLKQCVSKLTNTAIFIRRSGGYPKHGIFAFEGTISTLKALQALQTAALGTYKYVMDYVCLGPSHFIYFHHNDPERSGFPLAKWRSYRVEHLAYGYFLHNCIELSERQSVADNRELWFPTAGKESFIDGEAELRVGGDVTAKATPRRGRRGR